MQANQKAWTVGLLVSKGNQVDFQRWEVNLPAHLQLPARTEQGKSRCPSPRRYMSSEESRRANPGIQELENEAKAQLYYLHQICCKVTSYLTSERPVFLLPTWSKINLCVK